MIVFRAGVIEIQGCIVLTVRLFFRRAVGGAFCMALCSFLGAFDGTMAEIGQWGSFASSQCSDGRIYYRGLS